MCGNKMLTSNYASQVVSLIAQLLGFDDMQNNGLWSEGLPSDFVDLFEINEAFASVPMAWQKEMEYPMNQINVNGGAIALGHPLGATGARLMTTMVHNMKRDNIWNIKVNWNIHILAILLY